MLHGVIRPQRHFLCRESDVRAALNDLDERQWVIDRGGRPVWASPQRCINQDAGKLPRYIWHTRTSSRLYFVFSLSLSFLSFSPCSSQREQRGLRLMIGLSSSIWHIPAEASGIEILDKRSSRGWQPRASTYDEQPESRCRQQRGSYLGDNFPKKYIKKNKWNKMVGLKDGVRCRVHSVDSKVWKTQSAWSAAAGNHILSRPFYSKLNRISHLVEVEYNSIVHTSIEFGHQHTQEWYIEVAITASMCTTEKLLIHAKFNGQKDQMFSRQIVVLLVIQHQFGWYLMI